MITAACGDKPAGAMNEASVVALSVILVSSCSRNGAARCGRRAAADGPCRRVVGCPSRRRQVESRF